MSDPRIVASARNQKPGSMPPDSSRAWRVLGWIGLAFLIVGGMDFALVWLPLNFGNSEWQFATVTQSFNGLPILLLGLGLLMVSAEQVGRPWWGTLGMLGAGGLLLWMLVGIALWASNVSLALETVPDELASEVQRAVAKTAVQSVVYPLALVFLMWSGRSAARSRAAKRDVAG